MSAILINLKRKVLVYVYVFADVHYGVYVPRSSTVPAPGVADLDEEEPQALMFHGIILRSQLVTLLKERVFYSENAQVWYTMQLV